MGLSEHRRTRCLAQSAAPRQQQEGITPRSLFCLGSETAREAGPGKVTASGISLPSLLLGNPRDYSARGPGSGGGGGRWSPAASGPLGGHSSGDMRGPGTERCRCAWRQRRGVRCSLLRSGAPAPPPTPRTPRQMRAMAGAGRAPRPRLAGLRHPLLPSASCAASGSPRSRGSELRGSELRDPEHAGARACAPAPRCCLAVSMATKPVLWVSPSEKMKLKSLLLRYYPPGTSLALSALAWDPGFWRWSGFRVE